MNPRRQTIGHAARAKVVAVEGLRVNQRVATNPRSTENKLEKSISPGVHSKSIAK